MTSLAPYSGTGFWGLLLLFIAAHALLVRLSGRPAARNVLMIGASTVVVLLAHGGGGRAAALLLVLLALALAVFVTGRMLAGRVRGRGPLLAAAVALVSLFLAYFKYGLVQSAVDGALAGLLDLASRAAAPRSRHLFLLGVSYFCFKFIHFLVECARRRPGNLDLLTFVNYTLFFPSFFGGPINRYDEFRASLAEPARVDVAAGARRIVDGLFKKIVVAANLYPFSVVALDLGDPAVSPLEAVLSVYAYTLYVYFDFSGYTDLAIGSARLVGVSLPENFDYPLVRRNLQQFWAHWHMSLTAWLTDYVYWPLARRGRHLAGLRRRPVLTSCIAIFVTFVVCGAWHGDGLNFVAWGAYHGLGLAALNAYAQLVRRGFPRPVQLWVKRSRLSYALSAFVTVQYVVFGFLLFGCDFEEVSSFVSIFG